MTKIDKIKRKLNDSFKECLYKAFVEKYGIEIETYFAIFGDMKMHSMRVDKKNFTVEQKTFISSYELGYLSAMSLVNERKL